MRLKIALKNFVAAVSIFLIFAGQAQALSLLSSDLRTKDMQAQEEAFRQSAGFESQAGDGVSKIVAIVIKSFISLMGIIFVVLIVYAGYNWMTAGGEEAKVSKAKETIQRAIIGLVITLAAYSITYFVFANLDSVVSNT